MSLNQRMKPSINACWVKIQRLKKARQIIDKPLLGGSEGSKTLRGHSYSAEKDRACASFSDTLQRLKEALDGCEAVVIGAGAGLSTAAGFTYAGERFTQNFADFERKYGFHDMYAGGFYPYPTPEEHWAYWSRYIWLNRYTPAPKPVYHELLALVKDKDYFVLTTNVDHQFQKAGFDKKRLFYTQGDYGLFQCSEPCCQKTYNNEETVRQMVEQQKAMRVPSRLVPRCPLCGKPMTMNLRSDESFVEDEGWHAANARYEAFTAAQQGKRVLYFELGVGYNTPGIIKVPFWQYTLQNPKALYACVNPTETDVPEALAARAICLPMAADAALLALTGRPALEIKG